jgi:hypothetical protein
MNLPSDVRCGIPGLSQRAGCKRVCAGGSRHGVLCGPVRQGSRPDGGVMAPSPQQARRCGTSGKIRSSAANQARTRAERIAERAATPPCDVYRCGKWHLARPLAVKAPVARLEELNQRRLAGAQQ